MIAEDKDSIVEYVCLNTMHISRFETNSLASTFWAQEIDAINAQVGSVPNSSFGVEELECLGTWMRCHFLWKDKKVGCLASSFSNTSGVRQ